MKKRLIVGIFIVILVAILVIGFLIKQSLQNNNELIQIDTFEDFILGGSSFYQTDWTAIKEDTASEKELEQAYADIFNYLKSMIGRYNSTGIDNDCVEDKKTYKCLFIYAVIYGEEALCDSFPEIKSVEQCHKYGCGNVTVYYRDACIAQVKLFKIYSDSNDKINFCKSLGLDFAGHTCQIYTALKQKNYELCSDLSGGCYYPVVCIPNFPHISKEMYECRLRACEIDSKNGAELNGCKIGANNSNPEIYD